MEEDMKCDCCEINYEEYYYKHDNEILCWDCLIEKLEKEKELYLVETTHYYNVDWGELGTNDDISEVIQNICDGFDVEEIKS